MVLTYTLLYITQKTNKDLLFSTGNYTQNFVITYKGTYKGKIASLIAQTVKNLPLRQDTWIRSLDGEDPLGKIPWRRKWQPIPVFLPGKSHGQKSQVGYSPWGHKESDMTE